ncbi:hypothetical protein [Streptomyces aquilus]|uniref:hypothetical protein n=1 Tax=Streptomyces aquilus TaxID=2548456 RepID=UPI0036A60E53
MTKWSRNTKRALMGISATAAVLALGAAPALAEGRDVHLKSYSEDCGVLGCTTIEHADGYFYHDGDHWKVCDNYSDGDRAVLTVFWSDSTGDHQLKIQDTNGSGNSCGEGSKNLREGQKVIVRTWHQNGADGSEKDAKRGEGIA